MRREEVLERASGHTGHAAHAANAAHLPAWQAFNESIGNRGDVGIWHETYVVPKGHAESIYVNMPRYGLGLAGSIFAAKGSQSTASKRLAAMANRTGE